MHSPTNWREPGPPHRHRPHVERITSLRDEPNRWAQIATYNTRGSATSIMARLRHRMGDEPALDLTTRLLDDGRIGLFARWTASGKGQAS